MFSRICGDSMELTQTEKIRDAYRSRKKEVSCGLQNFPTDRERPTIICL